jgi:hypothetical protein
VTTTVCRRPIHASVEISRGSIPPAKRSARWIGVSWMRGLPTTSRSVAGSIASSPRGAPRYCAAQRQGEQRQQRRGGPRREPTRDDDRGGAHQLPTSTTCRPASSSVTV